MPDSVPCPRCGCPIDDLWELSLRDGGSTEVDCETCEGPVVIRADVTITYKASLPTSEGHASPPPAPMPAPGWRREGPLATFSRKKFADDMLADDQPVPATRKIDTKPTDKGEA